MSSLESQPPPQLPSFSFNAQHGKGATKDTKLNSRAQRGSVEKEKKAELAALCCGHMRHDDISCFHFPPSLPFSSFSCVLSLYLWLTNITTHSYLSTLCSSAVLLVEIHVSIARFALFFFVRFSFLSLTSVCVALASRIEFCSFCIFIAPCLFPFSSSHFNSFVFTVRESPHCTHASVSAEEFGVFK